MDPSPAQKYCANDVIYFTKFTTIRRHTQRENRYNLYNECLKFLNVRVELDLASF